MILGVGTNVTLSTNIVTFINQPHSYYLHKPFKWNRTEQKLALKPLFLCTERGNFPDVSACRCRHLPNNAAILSPSTPRVISLTSSISPYQGSTISPLTSNLWDPSLTLPGQDGIPVHDTLGNLINKRFLFVFVVCCLFCLFLILSCSVYFLPPLFLFPSL